MLLLTLTTLLLGRNLLLLELLHVGISSSKTTTIGAVVSALGLVFSLLLLVVAILIKTTS